jgi:tetratricopeptide (TPR) repeat protein
MAERKNPGTSRKQADSGIEGSVPKEPTRRSALLASRWFWGLAILLIGSATVARYSVRREPSALLEGVDDVAPEVAEVLYEMDDVARQLAVDLPQSPGAVFVIGRIHKDFGKTEAAIDQWHECIELDPAFGGAYGAIGLARLEMGQHEEAEEFLAKAVHLAPDSSRFAIAWAQSLLALGRTEEAVRILQADVDKHPRAMAAIALLGHTYVQLRQFEKGKEMLLKAVVLGPEYTNAYHGLVSACSNLGEKEEAKQYAAKLRELKAKDEQSHRDSLKNRVDLQRIGFSAAKLYVEIANEYIASGNTEVAEAYLQRSQELNPDSSQAYEVLAWLYVRQGRRREALSMLRELLARGEDSLSAQMRAGSLLMELGDMQAAEKVYRRAVELTPELAGGYAALASLFLQQAGRGAEAQGLAKKAVEMEPTAQYLLLLANASLAANDTQTARDAIGRASALAPQDPKIQEAVRMLNSLN